MLVLPEHVLEFLLRYKVRLEFLTELALAIPPELARTIPPELAPLLVLARLLALPDLVCALYGGHPPNLCSLVLYYVGCPTNGPNKSACERRKGGINGESHLWRIDAIRVIRRWALCRFSSGLIED